MSKTECEWEERSHIYNLGRWLVDFLFFHFNSFPCKQPQVASGYCIGQLSYRHSNQTAGNGFHFLQ